jgi:hypothetical protein
MRAGLMGVAPVSVERFRAPGVAPGKTQGQWPTLWPPSTWSISPVTKGAFSR